MKQSVWIGMFVGSTIGGMIPNFWGAGMFSFESLFLSALGACIGIYIAYKMNA